MPTPQHYLGRLLGTRPHWPHDLTEAEGKIMGEHFERLKRLTMAKKVLMAGPCFGDPVFGLCVLQVASEYEAREILAGDPTVKAGLMTYDLAPLTIALLADHRSPLRYAQDPSGKGMHKEVVVQGTIDRVWQAWTTTEGTLTFFSPHTKVELRPGGPYEIYFDQAAPLGQQGSEDCKILSFVPQRFLSFEWNAPPQFGELRDVRTYVVVQFEVTGPDSVRILFDHLGWGTGSEWEKVYDYFDRAWGFVLANCQKRFAEGPLDWSK